MQSLYISLYKCFLSLNSETFPQAPSNLHRVACILKSEARGSVSPEEVGRLRGPGDVGTVCKQTCAIERSPPYLQGPANSCGNTLLLASPFTLRNDCLGLPFPVLCNCGLPKRLLFAFPGEILLDNRIKEQTSYSECPPGSNRTF